MKLIDNLNSYLGEEGDKGLVILFASISWLTLMIVIIVMIAIQSGFPTLSLSDVPYILFGVVTSMFLCYMPLGYFLTALCQFIMRICKIKNPLKGVGITCLTLIIAYALYFSYRAWFPISSNEILVENYYSKQQNCRVEIIHSRKCPYYRPIFQHKEQRNDFIKFKYTLYCYCVNLEDTKVLDAISNRNCTSCDEGEYYDTSFRGHAIYFGEDFNNSRLKAIDGERLMKEYYKTNDLAKVDIDLLSNHN